MSLKSTSLILSNIIVKKCNLDLLWTEIEDKILQTNPYNTYFKKLLEIKGEERVKQRIIFLSELKI